MEIPVNKDLTEHNMQVLVPFRPSAIAWYHTVCGNDDADAYLIASSSILMLLVWIMCEPDASASLTSSWYATILHPAQLLAGSQDPSVAMITDAALAISLITALHSASDLPFFGASVKSHNGNWGVVMIRLQSPVSILSKCVVVTVHLGHFKRVVNPGLPRQVTNLVIQCWACPELSCMYGGRFTHSHCMVTWCNCLCNLLSGLDTGSTNNEMQDWYGGWSGVSSNFSEATVLQLKTKRRLTPHLEALFHTNKPDPCFTYIFCI